MRCGADAAVWLIVESSSTCAEVWKGGAEPALQDEAAVATGYIACMELTYICQRTPYDGPDTH